MHVNPTGPIDQIIVSRSKISSWLAKQFDLRVPLQRSYVNMHTVPWSCKITELPRLNLHEMHWICVIVLSHLMRVGMMRISKNWKSNAFGWRINYMMFWLRGCGLAILPCCMNANALEISANEVVSQRVQNAILGFCQILSLKRQLKCFVVRSPLSWSFWILSSLGYGHFSLVPDSYIVIIWTPILEWYVGRCESKNTLGKWPHAQFKFANHLALIVCCIFYEKWVQG